MIRRVHVQPELAVLALESQQDVTGSGHCDGIMNSGTLEDLVSPGLHIA